MNESTNPGFAADADIDDVEGHGLKEIAAGIGVAAIVAGGGSAALASATGASAATGGGDQETARVMPVEPTDIIADNVARVSVSPGSTASHVAQAADVNSRSPQSAKYNPADPNTTKQSVSTSTLVRSAPQAHGGDVVGVVTSDVQAADGATQVVKDTRNQVVEAERTALSTRMIRVDGDPGAMVTQVSVVGAQGQSAQSASGTMQISSAGVVLGEAQVQQGKADVNWVKSAGLSSVVLHYSGDAQHLPATINL